MTSFISKIATATLLSLIINAPFAIGEFLTRDSSGTRTDFPFALFIGLWIEAGLFVYVFVCIVEMYKNGSVKQKLSQFLVLLAISVILAWAWITLIIDQWPCFFLGGSGC